MKDFDLPYALKQQAWESAKAALRLLVSHQGSYFSGHSPVHSEEEGSTKFDVLGEKVEEFIKYVEDEGLHE